eukprot:3606292-Amphidinium_carterae.1
MTLRTSQVDLMVKMFPNSIACLFSFVGSGRSWVRSNPWEANLLTAMCGRPIAHFRRDATSRGRGPSSLFCSWQRKRGAHSYHATLIFMVDSVSVVSSFRAAMPRNMVVAPGGQGMWLIVPPDNTTFACKSLRLSTSHFV